MFSMLGVLGAMHIGDYIPILQAFNPLHAIRLLTSNPEWFLILGAVFLCTTGAEALYSDLGHCGINNIRTSWAFVKVMLILNYLGQGAWIIAHVNNLTSGLNPFYAIMPHGMLFFGIVMATIAAIIASQALISGSFTIFSEAMNLKFWPRQKIKYPTDVKGQLYIPFVNMSLFILCVIVILFLPEFGTNGGCLRLVNHDNHAHDHLPLECLSYYSSSKSLANTPVPYRLCWFGEYLLRRKHGKVYEWRLGNHASCQCDDSNHVCMV